MKDIYSNGNFTQKDIYSGGHSLERHLLRRTFTQRDIYSGGHLLRETFTQKDIYSVEHLLRKTFKKKKKQIFSKEFTQVKVNNINTKFNKKFLLLYYKIIHFLGC